MKRTTAATLCACVALIASATLGAPVFAHQAKQAGGIPVHIRVEGVSSTLLAETSLEARARDIDPDGKRADTCEGDTAAAALQEATHGHWTAGAYYKGLGYTVEGILGETHAFTSPYFWSLWIDGKAATVGICTARLHAGEHLLFFAECSKASAAECPQGLFEPPVLELSGPTTARTGQTIALTVHSLANANGKSVPGAGVTVAGGGATATTNAQGKAKLRLTKAGRYRILATAPGAIRDELTVRVHS